MNDMMNQELSPLAKVREALNQDDLNAVSSVIAELNAAEIARTLESLPPTEREAVWSVVPEAEQGNVLAHLGEDALENIIEDMSLAEIIHSISQMDDDDLVDFLQGLPDDKSLIILNSLDTAERKRLDALLEYKDDSAGGMMNTDSITVRPDIQVSRVIRYLRMRDEVPSATSKLFVVDRNSVLFGEVPLPSLIIADPDQTINDIMRREYKAFSVHDEASYVAQQFREADLISAAVVNDEGQLVGRITVDDVIDYIQEEAEKSLLNTAGLDEEVDTFAPIKQAAMDRGIWLGINLVTALLASFVINLFGATIEKVVALAALSPMVASMGGIAGSQSLTIIIRGIALGQIEGANARLLLMRELIIGVLNGLAWGTVTALISYIWFGQAHLALIVMAAIFINLCFAALSGVLIPLLLKRLNIDPALAGSVVLTTVTDVVGFLVLLGLATVFITA